MWIIGVVSLVVLSALIYRFGLSPASEGPAVAAKQSEQEMSVDDSASAAIPDSSHVLAQAGLDSLASEDTDDAAEPPPSATEILQQPIPPDPQIASQSELVRGMGGYTLVVGSTMNETTARQTLLEFSRLELPMGVLGYESNDVTRYRLAVGHYESAALADSARIQWATELPEGTWVLAIR